MKDPRQLKSPMGSEPNIIIIGAGAAGLACAVELKRYGFQDVRILEASNRIGGRIYTMRYTDEHTIDLGAQWVHGEQGNAVYQMVYDLDLLDSSGELFNSIDWIRSNGLSLERNTIRKLVSLVTHIFENRHQDLPSYAGTFGAYLEEKFESELKKRCFDDVNKELAQEFFRAFKKMEGAAAESDIEDMSGSGFETFDPCPGDNMMNWREKGFKQFLYVMLDGDEMNEQGMLADCIDFHSRVIKIEWDRMDGTVMVNCENQKSFVADHVVVTVSLGVLKKNTTLFDPRLPADKRRAINFTGFGRVCKIFVEFDKPFWWSSWTGFNAIWTGDDFNKLEDSDIRWITDIYGFYRNDYQPCMLQGWASGMYTEYIETIDTRTLTNGVMDMLQKFLPRFNIPQPKRVLTSKWTTDPAHLGAYSYPSMLTKSYNTGPGELSQPVNLLTYEPLRNSGLSITPMSVRPVLLFAGEATSPNHYSTVHGAVETGVREAHRLAGYYFKDCNGGEQ